MSSSRVAGELPELPTVVRQNVETYFGDVGAAWCRAFQEHLQSALTEWQLELKYVFPQLSINFVCLVCDSSGREAVLKLGCPNKDYYTECKALEHFSDSSAVALLRHDAARGRMLLDVVSPGASLASVEDDRAMHVAANCMKRLWKPATEEGVFPTVEDWYVAFPEYWGLEPRKQVLEEAIVREADHLFVDLIRTMGPSVVLHGDLHHDNILSNGTHSWTVIDPKGICGEPEYEVGALLRNPMPSVFNHPQAEQVFLRRVALLADRLGFDPYRLAAWSFAQGILSLLWSLDGKDDGWKPCYAWVKKIHSVYTQC